MSCESAAGSERLGEIAHAAADGEREVDRIQQCIALRGDEVDLRLIQAATHVEQLEIGDVTLSVTQLGQLSRTTQRGHLLIVCFAHATNQ
jgi:hypothetical protein